MGISSWLGLDVISNIGNTVKEIVGMFAGNRAAREDRAADENALMREAFGKEWSYIAANRNWFDSLIDGLNRLPRPIFAFGTIYIFSYCIYDPVGFGDAMLKLQMMPEMGWYLIFLVVSFFFGARTMEKSAGLKITRTMLEAMRKHSQEQKETDVTPNRV